MTLLIIFFLLSIGFSFLCSILEAVLLSVTPSYISSQNQQGTATGKMLQEYKEDIDKPLSAILTLNTIAHTVGAIGVGAMAGKLFGANYINIGPISLSYESVIAGVMTLAILILSEIIPKTLGANNWKSLTPFTVRTLRILMFLLAPFVWISQLITKTMKSDKSKSVLSRTDFMAMTNVVAESGELAKDESTIIKNVLNFEKMNVRDIMTPKTVAMIVDGNLSLDQFNSDHSDQPYSRLPVFGESKDQITGIVLKDDIYHQLVKGNGTKKISDLQKSVQFVSDSMPLTELFDKLSNQKQHLSIVADEFGNVVGLVSLEDVFETLLGREIIDETDKVADLQSLAKEQWAEKQEKDK